MDVIQAWVLIPKGDGTYFMLKEPLEESPPGTFFLARDKVLMVTPPEGR